MVWTRNQWTTRFGKFVDRFGVPAIASDLGVHRATLYNYLSGRTEPRRTMIGKIVLSARARAVKLSPSDIHRHTAFVRNEQEVAR